ncbi:hypothetical protein BDB01DRAFT_793390 [Pilobolus umbonatus]|nr:hypothetical protein BDB01DRAFT_793390 [Pilobolus umbonatus]
MYNSSDKNDESRHYYKPEPRRYLDNPRKNRGDKLIWTYLSIDDLIIPKVYCKQDLLHQKEPEVLPVSPETHRSSPSNRSITGSSSTEIKKASSNWIAFTENVKRKAAGITNDDHKAESVQSTPRILSRDTVMPSPSNSWGREDQPKYELRTTRWSNSRGTEVESNNWRSRSSTQATEDRFKYVHPDDRPFHQRKPIFEPYISPEDVEKGLADKSLYQGILRLSKDRNDSYVTCDELSADIYIGGIIDQNRALHGHLVTVKLMDVDTVWDARTKRKEKRRFRKKQETEVVDEGTDTESVIQKEEEEEEDEEEEEYSTPKPKFCGKVVAIIVKPKAVRYSGTVLIYRPHHKFDAPNPSERLRVAWFKPTDKRVPFIAILGNDVPEDLVENEDYYKTHLYIVDITRWRISEMFPAGRIVKELGPIGSLNIERDAILTDNDIKIQDFSELVLKCLPERPWAIPHMEMKKRRDMRKERIFTIDPSTAKDLDDALHIKELGDKLYEVGVHIADVSYFVRRETPLDTEARERGTSTYLVDKVIPMLPPLLSEELCSLRPGVDRLAFSVIWVMDDTGVPQSTWFGRTVIRSCAQLSYEDCQSVIDGEGLPSSTQIYDDHTEGGISKDIFDLYKLSTDMRQRRFAQGCLSMNSVKLLFELNDEGEPIEFSIFQAKEANRLVEEFMLRANMSVAEEILKAYPSEALLRRHPEPIERRLEEFVLMTDHLGLEFDGRSSASLQKSFESVDNEDVKNVLLILAVRSMQRAKYICAGRLSTEEYSHYALNVPTYTHFTSPIRRYADIIVHRQLQSLLDQRNTSGYDTRAVHKIAISCNMAKSNAQNAQETNSNLYLAIYLNRCELNYGPIYTKATVIIVSKNSYDVYIPEYGLQRRIHLSILPLQRSQFNKFENKLSVYWKRDIPVTMINEEKLYAMNKIMEEYSDEEEIDDYELVEDMRILNMNPARVEISTANELIPKVELDEETCMQSIQMFSPVNIRIQVNIEISPPCINVYPVNPFCKNQDEIIE